VSTLDDAREIAGSGPGGRIVKADVEAAATSTSPAPAPPEQPKVPEPVAAAAPETGTAKGNVQVEELTRIQQVIARRMAESKATVPEFVLNIDVDMEACVALRGQLKSAAESADAPVPSYNDMVVKACALALRDFPRANGSYKDGHFELHSRINVGVAVAADDALVVPTVFDADGKSLGEIARETRALAERVRAGTVTPPELSGGTFTVSSLGSYGVDEFTAVMVNVPLLPGDYFTQLAVALTWEDFALLACKTCGFGVFIAVVTCYQGLAQPLHIEEVSGATTRAVVQSVVACVLLDVLFIVIYLVM